MSKRINIAWSRLEPAIESDDSMGFCVMCGAEAYGVEPDAHDYRCETCDSRMVFGAEEILVRGWYNEQE